MSADLLDELMRHRDRIQKWIIGFGVPVADAEDVTQEVLSAAVRYISTYDPAKGALTAWLKKIARNEANRYFREKGTPPPEVLADQPAVETPERKAFDSEMERALLRVLDGLDASDRELLGMRFFEGLSSVEISTLLSIPEATVRSRLFRTLERCREGFEALGVKDSPGSLLVPLLLASESEKREFGGEGRQVGGEGSVHVSTAAPAAPPPRAPALVSRVLKSRWAAFAAGGALVYLLLQLQDRSDLLACGAWPRMMPITLACEVNEGSQPATSAAPTNATTPAKATLSHAETRLPDPIVDYSSAEGREVGKGRTKSLRE